MQRRPVQLILFFSLFLLAACNSPTSTPPHATATPVPSSVSVYYSAPLSSGEYTINALDGLSGKLRWSYTTSADGADSSPVLAEGVLYLTTSTSLIALNARDGTLRWHTPVPADTGIIGEENGILSVSLLPPTNSGPVKTGLAAFNTNNGTLRWSYQLQNGEGNLLAGGVLYSTDTLTPFGTPTSPNGSFLLAFNASDGSVKWKSAQESGYLTPLSVAEGLLYADNSFPMGGPETIEARRLNDGSTAWRFPSDGGHVTYLGLENNLLFVLGTIGNSGDLNQNLYALNATTGTVIWHAAVKPSLQVFADLAPQAVYEGDGDDHSLTALNAADGKQLWQTKLGGPSGSANAVVTAAAVVDGTVYLSYPGGFAALNASTGAIKWEAHDPKTQDPGGHPILAVRDDSIYSRSNASIVARSAQDGGVIWNQDVTGLQNDPIVG